MPLMALTLVTTSLASRSEPSSSRVCSVFARVWFAARIDASTMTDPGLKVNNTACVDIPRLRRSASAATAALITASRDSRIPQSPMSPGYFRWFSRIEIATVEARASWTAVVVLSREVVAIKAALAADPSAMPRGLDKSFQIEDVREQVVVSVARDSVKAVVFAVLLLLVLPTLLLVVVLSVVKEVVLCVVLLVVVERVVVVAVEVVVAVVDVVVGADANTACFRVTAATGTTQTRSTAHRHITYGLQVALKHLADEKL